MKEWPNARKKDIGLHTRVTRAMESRQLCGSRYLIIVNSGLKTISIMVFYGPASFIVKYLSLCAMHSEQHYMASQSRRPNSI